MLAVTVTMMAQANVYFTKDISAESLQKIYEVLGVPATGRVAVKISTGESQNSNQLKPSLIQAFVNGVDGTLVECNTTYSGSRSTTASHRQAIQLISSQAMPQSYNIFRIDGTPVGTNMKSLDALSEGLYIINGKKVAIK